MKKRIIAALLSAVAMFTACTGCASQPEDTVPETTISTETTVAPTTPFVPETTTPATVKTYPTESPAYFDADTLTEPPIEVYTMTGSENGLGGTLYTLYGTIKSYEYDAEAGIGFYVLTTDRGDVQIGDPMQSIVREYEDAGYNIDLQKFQKFLPKMQNEENVKLYVEYQGFSGAVNLPSFIYGGWDYQYDMGLLCIVDENGEDETVRELAKTFEEMLGTAYAGLEVTYDDTGITSTIWADGTAAALAEAMLGNAEKATQWSKYTESIAKVNTAMVNLAKSEGRDDLVVSIVLVSDLNHDDILLIATGGEITYNALESAN